MSEFGYWASIVGGVLIVVGTAIARRRPGGSVTPAKHWDAMALIGVGAIIGPLPWALGISSHTARIGASTLSILASVAAATVLGRSNGPAAQRSDI